MSHRGFVTVLQKAQRNRHRLLAGIAVVLALLAVLAIRVPLNPSLTMMLPRGSSSADLVGFFEELDVAGKVAISIASPGEAMPRAEFFSRVDTFAASLDSPLVTRAVSRLAGEQLVSGLHFFIEQTPALLDPPVFEEISQRLTPEGTEALLRNRFVQLMKLEGSFTSGLIRRDPLGLEERMIHRIRNLSASFGYTLRIEDEHIVSADGSHLLVLVETPVPFTDSQGSRELIELIDARRREFLEPQIQSDVICGHLHTLSNEAVIRGDIRRTMTVAGIAFLLLFVFYFKDARAGMIFLIPFGGVLAAVPVAALLTGPLSPMILGFGCVMAGIAVDYGIHTYIAIRRAASPVAASSAIVRPLTLSALTTAAVFIAFFFTRIQGYHQLAVFALVSIFVSLVAALFLLPLVIPPGGPSRARVTVAGRPRDPRRVLLLFLLGLSALIPLALRVQLDGDIARLDGSERAILQAEERFRSVWGGGEQDQAVLAVSGTGYEPVFERSEAVWREAISLVGDETLSSFHSVWKPEAVRRENSLRWNAFWTPERRDGFQQTLREKGRAYGFADDAFDPFFQRLEQPLDLLAEPDDNLLFDQLRARFVQQRNARVQVLAFFPDTEELVRALAPLADRFPDVRIVSRRALSRSLKEDYVREMARMGTAALLLMAGVVVFIPGGIRPALISLVPAGAALPVLLAVPTLVGMPLNVVSLIAAIMVIGLCIDYGIFFTYTCLHRLDAGTPEAVALSAGTTMIGAGALLFARHPALFSIGVTLVSGVLAGYLAARFAVPALCALLASKESR